MAAVFFTMRSPPANWIYAGTQHSTHGSVLRDGDWCIGQPFARTRCSNRIEALSHRDALVTILCTALYSYKHKNLPLHSRWEQYYDNYNTGILTSYSMNTYLFAQRLLFTQIRWLRKAGSTRKWENSDNARLIVADPPNCDVKLLKSATYRHVSLRLWDKEKGKKMAHKKQRRVF